MNPNINKINETLFAVNFAYVQMRWIDELIFINETDSINRYAALSEDGKLIVNTAFELSDAIIAMMQRIMQRSDKQLINQTAVMKKKVEKPHDDKYEDFLLCMIEWELKRRKIQTEYYRKHPLLYIIEKIKERWYNLWQLFKRLFN